MRGCQRVSPLLSFDSTICFMISFELAKELKDAGFYIHKTEGYYFSGDEKYYEWEGDSMFRAHCAEHNDQDPEAYVPHLEELIAGCCEEELEGRKLCFTLNYWPTNDLWYAGMLGLQEIGKTPDEAVAKLYIKLKK